VTPDTWLSAVLRREGWPAFTDHPADKGGPTKGGITLTTLTAWRTFLRRPLPTVDDLRDLSETEARDIYRHWYLEPWFWLGDDDLVSLCADWHVTSGPTHPTRAIQAFLGVVVDGVLGPKTVRAYAARALHNDRAFLHALYCHVWQARLRFYVAICLNEEDVRAFLRNHPATQLHFLRGWLNRALDLPATPSTGGGRDATLPMGPPGPAALHPEPG
jgi:lysozyme family protein